jgi:hypothetical protein
VNHLVVKQTNKNLIGSILYNRYESFLLVLALVLVAPLSNRRVGRIWKYVDNRNIREHFTDRSLKGEA